jgi:DNA-binding NtrC family response regulator
MSENGKAGKILIVDDDDMINEVLSFILGETYEVSSYLSAERALALEDMSAFDVVITDVNLPGIDGIQFLERIKSANPNTPVIVITGYKISMWRYRRSKGAHLISS